MKKKIRIFSLILLVIILFTYYPSIMSRLDNHKYYYYKDLVTGQEWEISKINNKRIEYPINTFDHMSDEESKQYDEINNELNRLDKIIKDNQETHDNYNNSQYTAGLTFDDLGMNGGNTLTDWEVTSILHEEAQKQLQQQQNIYMDSVNKSDDLKKQLDSLSYQLTTEAWDLRHTYNEVRISLIIALLLVILSTKLLRIFKKTMSFIIND